MKLEVGTIFTSKWFKGIVKILSIDEENNKLFVIIHRENNSHEEKWILHHTIWGFEQGEYKLKTCWKKEEIITLLQLMFDEASQPNGGFYKNYKNFEEWIKTNLK